MAIFTHCYEHRLNLVWQDASGKIKECKLFFANLSGFSAFFSRSTKRRNILDEICQKRLPSNSVTRWNFKSRITNTVFNNRDNLIQVFDTTLSSNEFSKDQDSFREAAGLKKWLNAFTFLFLLRLFNMIFETE